MHHVIDACCAKRGRDCRLVRFCDCCSGAEVNCGCDHTLAVDCRVFAEEVYLSGAEQVVVMLSHVSYFLWGGTFLSFVLQIIYELKAPMQSAIALLFHSLYPDPVPPKHAIQATYQVTPTCASGIPSDISNPLPERKNAPVQG